MIGSRWCRQSSLTVAFAAVLLHGASAWAQPADSDRFVEEPTGGVSLPTSGISGEVDPFATVTNPSNLSFQHGWQLGFALDAGLEDDATGSGRGYGFFLSSITSGGLLPRFGWGFAIESLTPPRVRLSPDPGEPVRFTSALSFPIGRSGSIGASWHHFSSSATLGGLDTFDIGLSMRFGARFALGAVVRDVGAPSVAGTPVQRRYEAEVTTRPLATDMLELALGGRVGETRADVDGWLRGSVRVSRGIFLRAQAEARELHVLDSTSTGAVVNDEHEFRFTAGLEVSFGGLGLAGYGTLRVDESGNETFQSGSVTMRLSQSEVPSVLPSAKRLEPIELGGPVGQRTLTRLVSYMRSLERDDDVVGVLLKLDGYAGGWATTRELRERVIGLRSAGKKVYAYMVSGTTHQYYLASAADKVYIDPAGGIRLQGFSATTIYFKGLFDKLGVEAEFEKIEEYKSAPEQWTRSGPTPTAYQMRNDIYDSIYGTVVSDIAASRTTAGGTPERIRALIDGGPYTAGDLEKLTELVDGVVLPDELSKAIDDDLGRRVRVGRGSRERTERWSYPKIAVIYIVGDIVDGKSQTVPLLGRRLVGGDTIRAAIAEARADKSVKAIILRISSPGGSALASELMAREVFKTRKVKPIICSMGNVAASGGYFAAAGCDTILASEVTITGSIGIFNGKFDLSGLLTRLGLSWTTYKRGAAADSFSFYRRFTKSERELLKEKLRYFYGRFVGAVADGRKMTTEQVDSVGRGHVWTGEQALPIKLIDELGGINEAIDMAKRRIGLGRDDRVRIMSLPRTERSLLSQVLGGSVPFVGLGADIAGADPASEKFWDEPASGDEVAAITRLLPPHLVKLLSEAMPGSLWAQPDAVQARLPFSILWD